MTPTKRFPHGLVYAVYSQAVLLKANKEKSSIVLVDSTGEGLDRLGEWASISTHPQARTFETLLLNENVEDEDVPTYVEGGDWTAYYLPWHDLDVAPDRIIDWALIAAYESKRYDLTYSQMKRILPKLRAIS
jgi:hypothetical protein